ncbi:MAG: hypothetical protein HS127_15135 [Planctomycetia bacterium]|nr:hypothetical protein [Planctomycetia bacterium]
MNKLMELYRDRIVGAISGLDRIRFRGTLRWLASERGMGTFMNQARILLKDFPVGSMGLRHRCETVVNRGRKIWVSRCGI